MFYTGVDSSYEKWRQIFEKVGNMIPFNGWLNIRAIVEI